MKVQFVTDAKGKVVSAVIPIKDYDDMMEKLEDMADQALIEKRRNEPTIPWEVVKREIEIRAGKTSGRRRI